ncbi:hypothetical protein STCU_11489 [Strigomonas culicis]|uniref:Uncharacterized protein n=1 Tax=Strigomonas culicis TaxID=28005 RepID=S9UNF8_9TRYP|nr:hypothetical protein STCU_11489 [Strigomonas culicis]|eukprot:EPY16196.1 hypothetical protein STCU_11489 [Strigomonas culicis]
MFSLFLFLFFLCIFVDIFFSTSEYFVVSSHKLITWFLYSPSGFSSAGFSSAGFSSAGFSSLTSSLFSPASWTSFFFSPSCAV